MFKIKTILKITTIVTGGLIAFYIPATAPFLVFIEPVICEMIEGYNNHNELELNAAIQNYDNEIDNENHDDFHDIEIGDNNQVFSIHDEMNLQGYILLVDDFD